MIDAATGEIRAAQVFVAVLGASNLTYAEARWTQSLPDWIGCHVGAFAYFGGVARQVVSDNLKAGVTRACFHEPVVNRTYGEMAAHYGTAILPARPYKPRDKSLPLRRRGPRSRSASKWCSVGSWRGCVTSGSSRSPR